MVLGEHVVSLHDRMREMDDDLKPRFVNARLRQLAEFRYLLRRFLSFSETEAERCGIAAQQYQLMQVIGSVPAGESASIRFLADRMVLRHNSAVELVDRAERAGLVRRVADQTDLRRSLVALTEQGEAVLERMIDAHLEQIDGETGLLLLRALQGLRQLGGGSTETDGGSA